MLETLHMQRCNLLQICSLWCFRELLFCCTRIFLSEGLNYIYIIKALKIAESQNISIPIYIWGGGYDFFNKGHSGFFFFVLEMNIL